MSRVTRFEAFRVSLPLVHAFETSSHRKSHLEHILIRVESPCGAVGWGEIASPTDPYYCPETVDDCWTTVERYLAPALLGCEWEHPSDVPELWSEIRGHNFAKAGMDIACWDLWSRAEGRPLATKLGGERSRIAAGVSLGIEPSITNLLDQVDRYAEEGYKRIKLKIAPGWDIEPVSAVRSAHPSLDLQVDANGAYTEDQRGVFVALDDLGLTMIEQPYAPGELAAHARLQNHLATAVCLDESIDDLGQLDTAIDLGAGRILNIKVSRMGGLTMARAAHDRAVTDGWQVWCGGMHEFGVGRAANVAIAALPGFTLPSDVSGSDKYYERDIIDPPVVAVDGMVDVPSAPGLGHEIDEPRVRDLASATLP